MINFIPVNIKNPILDSHIYTFCIGRKWTEIFSRYFSIISLEIKPSTFHFPISIIFISLVHVHPMANLSESSDMPVNRLSLSLKFWMFSGESTNIPMIACFYPNFFAISLKKFCFLRDNRVNFERLLFKLCVQVQIHYF